MSTSTATIEPTTLETTFATQREERFPNELYRYHGFRVLDSNGTRVGTVDWIWVNDATDEGDHVGLQLQWLRGKARAVPATVAHIDPALGLIRLPFTRQQIESAPRFRMERTLSSDRRAAIATHFAPGSVKLGSYSRPTARARRLISGAFSGTSVRTAPRQQQSAS